VAPIRLSADRFDDTVSAFCDAFYDYAVMRYVIGDVGDRYDDRLRALIGYFTASRFSRNYPVLGLESADGRLVAAANINPPHGAPAPASLKATFQRLGATLGEAAMRRYDAFVDAFKPFEPDEPHVHLGMIGVIREAQGQGHARTLLEAVHAMSRAYPKSSGVSLTTETPKNLPFYEHFGYRILGRGETPDGGLVTWTLFRADKG
jgi:GNAT superfamily N-acetyltransferase